MTSSTRRLYASAPSTRIHLGTGFGDRSPGLPRASQAGLSCPLEAAYVQVRRGVRRDPNAAGPRHEVSIRRRRSRRRHHRQHVGLRRRPPTPTSVAGRLVLRLWGQVLGTPSGAAGSLRGDSAPGAAVQSNAAASHTAVEAASGGLSLQALVSNSAAHTSPDVLQD